MVFELRARTTGAAIVLVAMIAMISSAPVEAETRVSSVSAVNPLASRPFYVDQDTSAARSVASRSTDGAKIVKISMTAQARWFGDWYSVSTVSREVDRYVTAATRAGAMPVLTLYAIPARDCGGFSAGGLAGPGEYAKWVAAVVHGIAGRPAAVVVEPDALTGLDCLGPSARAARVTMLKDAIGQLTKASTTAVYVDGGHSRWLSASTLAERLREVGVDRARGFSLNVANFLRTSEQVEYGEAVAAALGGAHYVIDTSRNGLGPAADGPLSWCNPAGRALGVKPTAKTYSVHADAFLWIKHPGESDGECGRAQPGAGEWFHSYAVGLVDRTPKSRPEPARTASTRAVALR